MTKELKKQVGEILMLALEANKNEDYNVWFNMTGHVNGIELQIGEAGDENYRAGILNDMFYYDKSHSKKEEIDQKIKEWKAALMDIIVPEIKSDHI